MAVVLHIKWSLRISLCSSLESEAYL